MAYSTKTALAAALAAVCAAACGGSDQNTPPQAPSSNTTATTAGTTDTTAQTTSNPQPSGMTGQTGQTSQGTSMGSTTTAGGYGSPASSNGTSGTSMASDGNAPSTMAPSAGSSMTGSSSQAGSDATLSDAQIAAIVEAANKGEVEQAKAAIKKTKNTRVRQFAQHMVTDHGAAMADQKTLDQKAGITPQDNDTSNHLKSKGQEIMSRLDSATGDDFDKAYIDAQVDEHQKVLELLNNKLIPQAQNQDLRSMLEKVRTKVAGHLKMAQDIQSSSLK